MKYVKLSVGKSYIFVVTLTSTCSDYTRHIEPRLVQDVNCVYRQRVSYWSTSYSNIWILKWLSNIFTKINFCISILYLPVYIFELIDIMCTFCSYHLELWHPIVLKHKHINHNKIPASTTIKQWPFLSGSVT